jgi:hypothetical protein
MILHQSVNAVALLHCVRATLIAVDVGVGIVATAPHARLQMLAY